MTNPAMEEIYALVERALQEGQDHIEVHAFPFRLTEANLAAHAHSEWHAYWVNLKEGYDLFERTRIPPEISVCEGRYVVEAGDPPAEADAAAEIGAWSALKVCATDESDAVAAMSEEAENAAVHVKPQTVVRNKRHARRIGVRNARKAYAAARRARMAAHAARMRTSEAVGKMRRQ
jgi:murein L,D-transpeptidase YafK